MADPQAMVDEVMAKENAMMTPVDTVRNFYAAIAAGDTGKMVSLMTPDIEWISVVDFNIQDRGPEEVMKKVFVPLMRNSYGCAGSIRGVLSFRCHCMNDDA